MVFPTYRQNQQEGMMKESFRSRMKRKIRETRIRICKQIIRKAVRRLDVLQGFAFLAYSWWYDEEIDYHVIKERSTNEFHQFGARVTYNDSCKQEDEDA